MTAKRITAALLVKHNACHDQVELFRRVFPSGCAVNLRTVTRAMAAGLNVRWAAVNLISVPTWKAYDEA
jgi:hypothetical protein